MKTNELVAALLVVIVVAIVVVVPERTQRCTDVAFDRVLIL